MLHVGVIGLGVGFQHLLGYLQEPHCHVSLVADRMDEKLAEVRGTGCDARTTNNAWDIIEDPSIDVVSIASFDADHFDQVVAALENGKHVFVEKPICQTLDQLRRIKEAWHRHNGTVVLRSNLVLRAAPAYRWLRDNIRDGKLGELYSFDGDYLYGRLSKITSGWRNRSNYYSVMAGGGIHLIDLLLWTSGQRPETVWMTGNRICTENSSFRFNDFVAATLSFPSGMIGRISTNFGCVHGHQHVVRAFGTKGTFILDDQGPRTQFNRDPAPPAKQLTLETLPSSKHVLIPEFVDAIRRPASVDESEETLCDFDAMSVCFACEAALESGTSQQVEYV